MTGSNKFSTVVAGIGLALLPAALFPAHAAPPAQMAVQILDPSGACASWTWGGTPAAPTVTCEPAAPPTPGVPSGCSLVANPSTLPAGGGQVALTATCTNGTDSATTWAWSGSGAVATGPGPSPQTQNVNVSATTTFGVIATNSVGPSANKTATVTVGAPPPPPPSGSIQCSGFANTLVWDMPWTEPAVLDTQGFNGSTAMVVRFTVPAGKTSTGSGTLSATDSATANYKYATISNTPCDFSSGSGGLLYNVRGPSSTISFGMTVGGTQAFNKVLLQAGQTYYMNLRNTDYNGNNSCPSGNCEAHIEFHKPKGT